MHAFGISSIHTMSGRQKRLMLVIGIIVVFLLLFIFIITVKGSKKTETIRNHIGPTLTVEKPTQKNASLPQILQLTITFDVEAKQFGIVKKVLTNGVTGANNAAFLPYQLVELDENNVRLFVTRFSIPQGFTVDGPNNHQGVQVVPKTQTILAVPYEPNAKLIQIFNNDKLVFTFPVD